MFKSLSGLFSTGPALPYHIDEEHDEAWGQPLWKHYRGRSKEDDSPVSIFKANPPTVEHPTWNLVKNGARRLKLLRHPNVLEYKDSLEIEAGEKSGGGPVLYIVTEPVAPLNWKLNDLNLQGADRQQYLSVGLNSITKAVSFLNNDCKLVHGNICCLSVVVTPMLDWKLHAFDITTEVGKVEEESTLRVGHEAVAEQYKPEELRQGDMSTIAQSPPWAVDAWGLGCFWQELFSGQPLREMGQLRNVDSLPKPVVKDYQRLLASNPARRLNPAKILETNEYFQNKMVDTITFLESLAAKDSTDKDTFFRKLTPELSRMCKPIAVHKVLPMVSQALELGSVSAVAMQPWLQIAKTLPAEQFSARIIPTVIKLFASADRAVRVTLLNHMELFIEHLSAAQMDEQLVTGYSDSTAYVRELTLKCTLVVAPKLQQKTINQQLLKHLSKLQIDEEQAIRANTTICLGNLARYMGEASCKRVLLNAFTRALKDTFPPTRAAGMITLVATAQYYDAAEVATRIIPAVGPLCIDAEIDVRSNAFKCMDCFLSVLKTYSQRVTAGENPADTPLVDMPAAAPGLLRWAVGSIATAATSIGGGGSASSQAAPGSGSPASSSSSVRPSGGASESASAATTGHDAARATGARAGGSGSGGGGAGGGGGGGLDFGMQEKEGGGDGDGDGWGDSDEDEELAAQLAAEEEEARARSKARTAGKAAAPAARAEAGRRKSEDGDDGDGWGELSLATGEKKKEKTQPPVAPPPVRHAAPPGGLKAASAAAAAAGTPPSRARPPVASKPKLGAQKLGAQKLGAQKLTSKGGGDFDWADMLNE